ncbi:acyl-CoA dehydrogenase [Actinocorallia herbida]|uniref:Acyl-CoA dehydrogenase n=1 Tax=Actinocorallia herbida TaxID=58109 RepID=A0A3N1D3C5_9ACTN|nr:acyl-CoA dehydrogenase family protein [Actinocorallia herbida]ROO88022.1 acyl-CoA dehydrogenase [Actinocorallia herbida]
MTDELRLLADTCDDLFAEHATGGNALWKALEGSGLTLVSVAEEAGGAGGTLREAAVIAAAAGEHAADVPVGETALLGGWLCALAGLPLPAGPLTAELARFDVRREGAGLRVRGELAAVPWGRAARTLALVDTGEGSVVVSLRPDRDLVREGMNLAGEPRDDLRVDALVSAEEIGTVPGGAVVELRRRRALLRTVLTAGAARRVLALTLRHAAEREQFGRPLSRFQAVQQQVAELAAESAAIGAAADAAVEVCAAEGSASALAGTAVAAAKVQAARGSGVIARIAHQVHGAIGFTDEHVLGRLTTRLWSWRDEAGTEAAWAAELGESVVAAGPGGAWSLLTQGG